MSAVRAGAAERALSYPRISHRRARAQGEKHERRWAFIVLIALFTLIATAFETSLLGSEGWTPINLALLVCFVLLFAHVAIGFCQAFIGFLALSGPSTRGGDSGEPPVEDVSCLPLTAIVVPIYNEEVAPVFARLRVMHDLLYSLGAGDRFHFFVLSDSSDRQKAFAEELAWTRFVAETGSGERAFYRHRALPLNRKSGNIADFCRRWGRQYRYMICLDADSLLSGETMLALVRRMEANERIGILQTVPQAINGLTIWSRVQQFAMALYGPIFAAGADFWQQEASNFWGHNAIIRLAPFIQHCALPELPGGRSRRRPMSHDFVEAALMRRAGWEVHLAHDLAGSYEETPPNVTAHLQRDRRWCQGNLEHSSLLVARGFKPISRFHFFHGIFSFIASPLLVLVLILGFCKSLGAPTELGSAFAAATRTETAIVLFSFTMLLLVLPKFLAIGLALWKGRAAEFGGRGRLLASTLAEILLSVLIAPVFLFFHAQFVLFNLLGKKVAWNAQRRGAGEAPSWREATEVVGLTSITGLCVSAVTAWLTPGYLPWLVPVVIGWLLAVPLVALTGDCRLGRRLWQAGLFLIPNEVTPPAELKALRREQERSSFSPNDLAALVAIDPFAQRLRPNLTSEIADLHHRIWTTPDAELPAPWRDALRSFSRSLQPAVA